MLTLSVMRVSVDTEVGLVAAIDGPVRTLAAKAGDRVGRKGSAALISVALSAVVPLSDAHDLEGFECGKSALDDWLRTFARANQRQDFTRVMVIHDDGKVVGYYGLAPSDIAPGAVPRRIRTGRQPAPIPCLLIGQLRSEARRVGKESVSTW